MTEEGVGRAEAGLDMGVAKVQGGMAKVQGGVAKVQGGMAKVQGGMAKVQGGMAKGTGEQYVLMTIPGIPKCCSKIQIIKLWNGHMYKCKVMIPTDIHT